MNIRVVLYNSNGIHQQDVHSHHQSEPRNSPPLTHPLKTLKDTFCRAIYGYAGGYAKDHLDTMNLYNQNRKGKFNCVDTIS